MPSLSLLKELRPYTTETGGASISPDGQYLAVAYPSEGKVVIYRTSDWSIVTEINEPVQFGVGFSPNGSWLGIACGSSGMKIYSVPSFSHLQTLNYGLIDMRNIPWAPDSTMLLLLCSDNYLRLISTSDWSLYFQTNQSVLDNPLSLSGKYHASLSRLSDELGGYYVAYYATGDDEMDQHVIETGTGAASSPGETPNAIGILKFPFIEGIGHVTLRIYGPGKYEIFRWATNEWLKTWDFGTKNHINAVVDHDGTVTYVMLALEGDWFARMYTCDTIVDDSFGTWHEELIAISGNEARGLALSPNNDLWVVTDDQGYIRVYTTKIATQITLEITPL